MNPLRYTSLPLLLLGLVLAAACSQGESSSPSHSEGMEPPSPTQAPETELPTPTPTPAEGTHHPGSEVGPEAALLIPTPTPAVRGHSQSYAVLTKTPAAVGHRILLSDVVVRASFSAATATVKTVPSDAGVAPTYRAALELHFTGTEYLKGDGTTEIAVEVLDGHTYPTREEASEVAQLWLRERDTTWDDREAVLFLASAPGAGGAEGAQGTQGGRSAATAFRFTETQLGGHHLDGGDKTWLPASPGQASGQTGGADPLFLTGSEPGEDGSLPTISLSELRSRVSEVAAILAKGAGIEGYEDCIESKFDNERWERAYEAYYGETYAPIVVEKQIASGLPAGTQFHHSGIFGGEYNFWLVGPDAALFRVRVSDTGLYYTTARPLPGGLYAAEDRFQFDYWVPCNYVRDDGRGWAITVTAPADTVHEAFFDILAGAAGVPLPSDFTVGGVGTGIHWLEWRDGTVLLLMAPYVDLKGHTLDFIALDGTVALSLDAGAATADPAAGTLTWAVASQPWREDDQLMLRIRKSATGPTATPTPTPTPTPVPLAAPDAPANLAAAPEPTAVGLTWETVAGAARYRVEHRPAGGSWTTNDEQVAAPPYQVTGLTCATAYEFRVSAYGDGSARAADWGAAATVSKSTAACPPAGSALSPVVAKYDENGNGRIEATEYYAALRDYGAGKITYLQVLEVAEAYQRTAG